jgi:integrase
VARRASGEGTVERRTNDDGTESYRARVPTPAGGKVSGPWVASRDEADGWRVKLLERASRGIIRDHAEPTLADFWPGWIEELERLRKPRASHYHRAWVQHVQHHPIARLRLSRVDTATARDFVSDLLRSRVAGGSRVIAPNTAKAVVTATSAAFKAALRVGKVRANPFQGLEIEWPDDDGEGEVVYLSEDEIATVRATPAIAEDDRLVILFYLYTGLRAGEGVFMPLDDLRRAVTTGELFVRYGSKGRKPKGRNGGKTRTVPLLPAAREVAETWLARLPAFCPTNELRLAFPTADGSERRPNAVLGLAGPKGGKYLRWHDVREAAGVRPITWHGLRHTCGAALASGWWGRVWSLHEIRDLLGHSSVTTTERYYGHLAPSALRSAALATPGPRKSDPPPSPAGPQKRRNAGKTWPKTTSSRCSELAVIPGGCVASDAPGGLAGLRAGIDARLAARDYPTPDECAAIADEVLALDDVARLARAVLDAAPQHRLARLLDLLRVLPAEAGARRAVK